VERFSDEALGDFRAVCVGRIDQGDAEFDGTTQNAARFIGVVWLSPRSFADKTHGSITEAVDGKVAANLESAAG
jgi:hypothetical protein